MAPAGAGGSHDRLEEAPDEWFSGKQRRPQWPNDLDGHSSFHRVQDIECALESS